LSNANSWHGIYHVNPDVRRHKGNGQKQRGEASGMSETRKEQKKRSEVEDQKSEFEINLSKQV
jgi:hypothetical protein